MSLLKSVIDFLTIQHTLYGTVVQRKTYSTPIVQGNGVTHLFFFFFGFWACDNFELPYEGAKEMLLVDEVDNKEFLAGLFHSMYEELPTPKTKKKK